MMQFDIDPSNRRSVLIDVDTGEDDALALLAASQLRLPIEAVITSYGNSNLENATGNSAAVLEVAQNYSIPIIPGADRPQQPHPLESQQVSAGEFVGTNGLCNLKLPPLTHPERVRPLGSRLSESLEAVVKVPEVDYIVTGPLTNLAELLARADSHDHGLAFAIRDIYIMGGAFRVPGNTGPLNPETNKSFAEFNVYCDPFAADAVLKSGRSLTVVPWDVTSQLTISPPDRAKLESRGALGDFTLSLMDHFFDCYGREARRPFELNDVVTILAWVGLGHREKVRASITLSGQETGRTRIDPHGHPLALFALGDIAPSAMVEYILGVLEVTSR